MVAAANRRLQHNETVPLRFVVMGAICPIVANEYRRLWGNGHGEVQSCDYRWLRRSTRLERPITRRLPPIMPRPLITRRSLLPTTRHPRVTTDAERHRGGA